MSASNYLENKTLDAWLGGTAFTPPANVFLAVHTADPTETGTVGEVTTNGASRTSIANNTTNWPNAVSGSKSNGTTVNLPTPTGAGWGLLTHYTLWDALTGGNCLFIFALTTPKTVNAGDPVSFANGAIVVGAD